DEFFESRITPQPGDLLILKTGGKDNAYTGDENNKSHTTTVESYGNYVISSLEGNRGQSVSGSVIDLREDGAAGKIICLIRVGTEFYTENKAPTDKKTSTEKKDTTEKSTQNSEKKDKKPQPSVSADDILFPLRHMVRNLQMMAGKRNYIDDDGPNATVANMAGKVSAETN
ncbi:MAG: hypothetical protein AAF570_22695, partial [Bacteroidota bacterium]